MTAITATQLENCAADALTIEAVANNAPGTTIVSRLGRTLPALSDLGSMAGYVPIAGDVTKTGIVTFNSSPIVPDATTSHQAVAKGQLDAYALDTDVARAIGFSDRPNSKIAIFGDSITAQNTSVDGRSNQSRGYMVQARFLSMCRFEYDADLNFGVSGDTTTDMLARISDVVAANPARVFVLGGTNDLSGGSTAADIMDNLRTIIDTFNEKGIAVDMCPILPRTKGMTTTIRNNLNHLNHLIINESSSRDPKLFCVVPANIPLIDLSSATGDPITGGFFPETDSTFLHPQDYGATLMGQAIAAHYSNLFPNVPVYFNNQSDVYDATYNPFGSINTNPWLAGTSGTVGAGNVTGDVCDGFTIQRSSGSKITAVASKGTDPAPQNGITQIITLGGAGGGALHENMRMIQTAIDFSSFNAGDKFIIEIDVEQNGLSNVENISALLQSVTSSTWYGCSPSGITGDRTIPTCRRLIRSHKFTLTDPAEVVNASLNITADCTVSAPSGTVTVRKFSIRKVS